ncbi:unnamed protein product [Spirodela intermedia]|uniref:Uncharacterized protein n=1 Tax=Spirodela intermedia TaxID=51605 RepID=A0A7I8KDP0_SPIIN|nr:unnamed protein product [Spirodela intermedia]
MSTLQRSSVSFRRQGSSGRIWHEAVHQWELKGHSGVLSMPTVSPPAAAPVGAAQQEKASGRCSFFPSCMRPSSSS